MRKNWDEEEIEFLKNNYPTHGREYCGKILNRGIESVRHKADKLGIKLEKEARSRISKEATTNANKERIIDRTGEKSMNFQGYEITVIESYGAHNLVVEFNDVRKSKREGVSYQEFIKGSIKNLYHADIYGVGYFGEGEYTARVGGKMSKCYATWINMLDRCYSKNSTLTKESYKDVTVCDEWHNFQNFAKWFYENYNSEIMKSWHLDKDIICPDCKIYSPETCCIIPIEINTLFSKSSKNSKGLPTGVYYTDNKYSTSISKFGIQHYLGLYSTIEEAHKVYIEAKRNYLIEVSEKWRDILSDKVCDAIKNFDISLL